MAVILQCVRGAVAGKHDLIVIACAPSLGVGLAVLLGSTSSYLSWKQEEDAQEKRDSERTTSAVEGRHAFVYRDDDAIFAIALVAECEAMRSQIEQFLGVTVPTRLVVDMTGGLERHAGRAYWKKIRMSLSGGVRDQAVFAHELTHVLLEQAARGRLEDSFNSTRFFHEGLATFVERSWFPLPEGGDMEGAHRVAAVARTWHELRFEELVDDKRLALRLDRDLVYPVGAVFVDALVRRHGTNAPGRVAAAFGRADAPKGLSGMTLWRDTMQSCGFNLSEVVADFYTLLEQASERHKQFIAELPRLQGAMEIVGDQVVIRAVRSRTGSTDDLHCRVRQSADADPQFELHFRTYDKDQFRVPKGKLSGRSFWYQLGVKHSSVPHIIYEPWVEARLP